MLARIRLRSGRRENGAAPRRSDRDAWRESSGHHCALDQALQDLAKIDERKSRIIELRYFGGLSMDDTAEVAGISVATVRRELRLAETWLYGQMKRS